MSSNFRTCNIVRLYMRNFLTYEEVEVEPQPNLNVIIGPNGTGKSSILCAICLVLGGKPEVTGRGKLVKDYVQYGKDVAVIEIELYNAKSNNYVIRRTISLLEKASGSSEWWLQGVVCKEIDIKKKVQQLGIKIDNLCTFLPQDRVTEFARMNKIQLLQSTELAVGRDKLADQHETLRQFGKGVKDLQVNHTNLISQLEQETSTNDKLKDQVVNVAKKKDLEISIKDIKEAILCNKYNSSHRKLKTLNEECKIAKERLNELVVKMEPYESQKIELIKEMEKEKKNLKEMTSRADTEKNRSSHIKQEIYNLEEQIAIAQEDYKQAEEDHQTVSKEINNLKKQIEVLRGQIMELNNVNESSIQQQVQNLDGQIVEKCSQLSEIQTKSHQMSAEKANLKQKINQLQAEISKLENVRSLKLQILLSNTWRFRSQQYKQIYEATNWINNNRNKFKGMVHDPIFSCIEVRDLSSSIYIENVVSDRDLVAFVCENKEDIQTIKRYADNKRWAVNLVHSDDLQPEHYVPTFPIESLRQRFGFQYYLKDLIRAPPAVMSYLCKNFNLHKIPVSAATIDDIDRIPQELPLFYMGKKRCYKKKSKYDCEVATSISDIHSTPRFLSIADNSNRLQNLQTNLERLIAEETEISSYDFNEEKQQIEEELRQLRAENNLLKTRKSQREQLERSLQSKENSLRRKQSNVIDLNEANKVMNDKIKKAVDDIVAKTVDLFGIEKKISDVIQTILNRSYNSLKLPKKLNKLTKDIEEDKILHEEIKAELVERELKQKQAHGESRKLLNDICSSLGITSHELTGTLRRKLVGIATKSLEELEQTLAEKETMRDCLGAADEAIIDEYNRREAEIERLREAITQSSGAIENQKKSVDEARHEWLPEINRLIVKINQHFSSFMAKLNCAGEVLLDKGVDEDDFTNYGIAIRVKFRDDQKLRDLTAHQQSGGERSVSTALYLMALQTLTAVPFRCVDEINQGMDPTNERNMFTMLVGTTTTETASQYFLVTPKLLPNLPYNERVNFINVFNSSRLEIPKYFSLKKTLERLRKLKAKRQRR